MKTVNRGIVGIALVAMMALLSGCSGESPTTPTPVNPPPGGGGGSGTPPPTAATIVLAASNPSPVVRSTSTITATVTQGGTAVPNGTAVEFETNLGTFIDTASATTIRTTTNGVASATLTSGAPGLARVTVRVNNAVQTIEIRFLAEPVVPPIPPPLVTSVTSVTPGSATPQGGETITIRGTNFNQPLRVFFGDRPAVILSSTLNEIRVLAPQISLGPTEQFREVQILVISESETPAEQRAVAPSPFRYEVPILSPVILDVAPSSGPNEGNTRITIFGEGFQRPLRAFFGTSGSAGGALTDQVELEIIDVTFDRVIAMTPPALGLGAALRDQQVTLRVLNQGSGTDAVVANAFRYGPGMQITAVGPTSGSALGGTRVRIDGWGFDEPVAVTIGGIGAGTIVDVAGTQIIALTGRPLIAGCDDVISGPVSVTNVEDGGSAIATGIDFDFIVPKARIVEVSPTSGNPGTVISVLVVGTSGFGTFTLGDQRVNATRTSYNSSTETAEFTFTIPSNLEFDADDCGEASFFDLAFEDAITTCGDTLTRAISIAPPQVARLFVEPDNRALNFSGVVGAAVPPQTVTVTNTGTTTLTITSAGPASPNPPFSSTGISTTSIAACESAVISVSFTPTVAGSFQGSLPIASNGGSINILLSGTATVPPPPED